jgi:hypothetical protein
MKIGKKVIVKPASGWIDFSGKTGTIVEEHIPNSQMAMLCGVSKWHVQFDKPIVIQNETITGFEFREDELALVE